MMQPMCVLGCLDEDPDPYAVGYFLAGAENQYEHCAAAGVDLDQDGLDDYCEYKLAHTFRPLMSFAMGDDVGRESRWAAQWLSNEYGTMTVRIAYLIGYWMDYGDGGTSLVMCENFGYSPIGWLVSLLGYSVIEDCSGHAGDSEWVLLDVKYNEDSKHWYLANAVYSAHTWHVFFAQRASDSALYVSPVSDGGGPYTGNFMEYVDKTGGYPVAYVADRKHATYPTISYCNGPGGWGASDNCDGTRTSARFNVAQSDNIGSRSVPFIDCVPTQDMSHPSYGSGREECYWTVRYFRGWFPVSVGGGNSTSYSTILGDMGF